MDSPLGKLASRILGLKGFEGESENPTKKHSTKHSSSHHGIPEIITTSSTTLSSSSPSSTTKFNGGDQTEKEKKRSAPTQNLTGKAEKGKWSSKNSEANKALPGESEEERARRTHVSGTRIGPTDAFLQMGS
ncbi:hypothetical protein MMC09_001620 [Bachmanniomyces sp. S44760]|nr:hypothetical protein [Bachmanniomyces sp. S44760]